MFYGLACKIAKDGWIRTVWALCKSFGQSPHGYYLISRTHILRQERNSAWEITASLKFESTSRFRSRRAVKGIKVKRVKCRWLHFFRCRRAEGPAC